MDEKIVVGVKNPTGVLAVVRDRITGRESLEGIFGSFDMGKRDSQRIYESISFRNRFNVSIKLHKIYHRKSDGLNDLINGSVDILLYSQHSSIAEENCDSLLSLPDTGVDQLIIITPYDCSLERSINQSYRTDLLESVTGFNLDVWIITIFSLITIAMLINIHIKTNQVSRPWMNSNGGFWTIISFLLKNPSMININWVSSILRMLVAVFVLFFSKFYFENIIKSDQISTYQPTVYKSYTMIAEDPEIQVAISSNLKIRFKAFCEQEPPHSKYRKIFHNNFEKYGMDKMSDMERLTWLFSTPRDKKALIRSGELGSGSRFCKYKEFGYKHWDFDDLCIYEHFTQYGDPEKDELRNMIENKAFLISLNFTRKKIFKRFLRHFNQAYEMGMNPETTKRRSDKLVTPSIADCVPQKPPVTHDRGSRPIDLYNYKFSFTLIVMLYSVALVILMFEIRHHHYYSSDNISSEVIEISVQWKKPKENHLSIASTVQAVEYRDEFVEHSIQSVANKKSKLTDVKSGHNSKIERHQICTAKSKETDTVKTDTTRASSNRLNCTKKMVTHVAVVNSIPSIDQSLSSGKKFEKRFVRKRIVPVLDDRILKKEYQTCKKTDTIQNSSKQTNSIEGRSDCKRKLVTHTAVVPSTSKRVSSCKKKFGRNRIVPVFGDTILTEGTQTCQK